MAGGIDWFRWHHGSVTDPKFQLIAKKSGASLPDVLAVWAYLLEQASANEIRGNCGDIDCEAVDCMFGFEDGQTEAILKAMQSRNLLIDGQVAAWDKRQPKREDETAAERKRRQREREHELQVANFVTTGASRNVTQCHTDVTHGHDRGEERREEEKREEGSLSGKIVGAADAATPPAQKAARLADGWQLPKAWGEWALAEYPHWTADVVRLEAQKFFDHWRAQPGKDGRKADWPATWRNWCRNDICQRSHPPPHAARAPKPGRMTDDERAAFNASEADKAKRLLFGNTAPADVIENEPLGVGHEAG